MRIWLGFLLVISATPSTAFAASREINPYLTQAPQSYGLISKPEKWEDEGMRGYEAKISVQGRVFDIVATCALSAGENEWIPALEVTVLYGDERSVFDLSGPGELNHDLRLPLMKSEIIPHDFYTKTCRQNGGDEAESVGQEQPEVVQSGNVQNGIDVAGQTGEGPVKADQSASNGISLDVDNLSVIQSDVVDLYQKYSLAKICVEGDISQVDLDDVKRRLTEMDGALKSAGMDPDELWNQAVNGPSKGENGLVMFSLTMAASAGPAMNFHDQLKYDQLCNLLVHQIELGADRVRQVTVNGSPSEVKNGGLTAKDF